MSAALFIASMDLNRNDNTLNNIKKLVLLITSLSDKQRHNADVTKEIKKNNNEIYLTFQWPKITRN